MCSETDVRVTVENQIEELLLENLPPLVRANAIASIRYGH